MKHHRFAILGALFLLLGLAGLWWLRHPAPPAPPVTLPPAKVLSPPTSTTSTPLGDLADPTVSPARKVRRVHGLLQTYLLAVKNHPGRPLSTNAEFTRTLTGQNPLGVIFLPPDNPAISARGELLDGWNTPYFFHALAADSIEVISAGPDRIPFNADDLIFPASGKSNSLEAVLRPGAR